MAPLKTLISVTVFMFTVGTIRADDPPAFSDWLGPQTNDDASLFAPVVGKRIDPTKHDKLPRYKITLEIVKGGDIRLPLSENHTITFDGKEFSKLTDFHPDKDAAYLLCQMQLKPGALGWRFYTMNARVTDGILKGAIVHFRDGRIQESITDPCVAVYRIPEGCDVKIDKVPFEIVALFAK